MNLNKFTEKAQEAVLTAQNLATELNHAEVTPEHLLVALVEQSGGIVPSVLRKMTLDPATRRRRGARRCSKNLPQAYGADVRFSPRMKLIFDSAQAEAQRLQDEYVSTEHLLRRAGDRGRPLPRRAAAAAQRRHQGRALRGADAGARQPARHVAEPGGDLRGARPLRPRPDRAGAQGQARSGHRPRRGSPPRRSRCCRAAPRTTRCSSASPASARRPSSKAWRSASSAATCPKG